MAIKLGLRFELRLDECRRFAVLSFWDLLLCEAQKNVVKEVVLKILSRVAVSSQDSLYFGPSDGESLWVVQEMLVLPRGKEKPVNT